MDTFDAQKKQKYDDCTDHTVIALTTLTRNYDFAVDGVPASFLRAIEEVKSGRLVELHDALTNPPPSGLV
ncbi:MAG: hypothetical protein HYR88_15095 [Verrucomicrobia bacterium]|nr:hypothetical protein [Verrucomicrobiota bacterium]MBI3866970.1 hypothetical protein [Verrucomicrobiota bacterium]